MVRVNPDANDIIVWLLDETSGPYRNTGTLSPNSATTDLTISGTIVRTGTGLFGGNCAFLPGPGNYPSGASSTRNYAGGAKTINPSPPFTVSAWVYLKSYTNLNNMTIIGKEYRDSSLISSWTAPFHAVNISTVTTNGGLDWVGQVVQASGTQSTFTITDNPIPLAQWSHVGLTHDGTNIRVYLNGAQCIRYSGATQLNTASAVGMSYTDGVNGNGLWRVGAVTATGSSSKEELPGLVQDVRIANIVRPLSYFQNIYRYGILPLPLTTKIQYYKLRVYDLSCVTPTPITWVDTQISLTNAPVAPCGGPFSGIEILDSWFV